MCVHFDMVCIIANPTLNIFKWHANNWIKITVLPILFFLLLFIYLSISLFSRHTKLSKTTVTRMFLQFMYQCKNKLIFKAVSIFLSVIFCVWTLFNSHKWKKQTNKQANLKKTKKNDVMLWYFPCLKNRPSGLRYKWKQTQIVHWQN